MTTLPQNKSFPWKWNDCMTNSMNHEHVNSSWTSPCLAISLGGFYSEIRQHYTRACWGFCDYHSCLEQESGLVYIKKKSIRDKDVWLIVAITHMRAHTHTHRHIVDISSTGRKDGAKTGRKQLKLLLKVSF